jgi:hypothetical protein
MSELILLTLCVLLVLGGIVGLIALSLALREMFGREG